MSNNGDGQEDAVASTSVVICQFCDHAWPNHSFIDKYTPLELITIVECTECPTGICVDKGVS